MFNMATYIKTCTTCTLLEMCNHALCSKNFSSTLQQKTHSQLDVFHKATHTHTNSLSSFLSSQQIQYINRKTESEKESFSLVCVICQVQKTVTNDQQASFSILLKKKLSEVEFPDQMKSLQTISLFF